MLNLKICLVDFNHEEYDISSLYNDSMSRSQLDLLYLASALAVRPNQITLLQEREQAKEMYGIRILPLPTDSAQFWSENDFDIVVCLDSLEGSQDIYDHLPEKTLLVLWTHLMPEHIGMLPLKNPEISGIWSAIVCESASLRQAYHETLGLPLEQIHYRYPAIVRTLRRRFSRSSELAKMRNPAPTLAYTAPPDRGLDHILKIFQLLQEAFSDLCLEVLLPGDFQEDLATEAVQQTLQSCRDTDGVSVSPPQPWPSYVEILLKCHFLCNPLGFFDPGAAWMIDALGTGCQAISIVHPSLQEIARDLPIWVEHEPADDYLSRYTRALSEALRLFQEDSDYVLKRAFSQVAAVNTYYTWDLRVWEWESLFFALLEQAQQAPPEQAA